MNAAELDRLIVAEDAYKASLSAGGSEEDALAAARAAIERKKAEQVLRRVGIHGEELDTALKNMGHS